MKLMLLAAGLGLVTLAGCTEHPRTLEAGGALSVLPSNRAGSDYAVQLKNTIGMGWDPDNKQNRDKWALDYIKAQCPSGRIVGEDIIATGTYLTGSPARTYIVYVKCR